MLKEMIIKLKSYRLPKNSSTVFILFQHLSLASKRAQFMIYFHSFTQSSASNDANRCLHDSKPAKINYEVSKTLETKSLAHYFVMMFKSHKLFPHVTH